MRDAAKCLTGWAAILAVALQAVFGGAATQAIAAPLDPTAIICHSGASDSDADRQSPATSHDCCTQCVLCSPLSAATAPDSFVAFVPSQRQVAAFIPFSAVPPSPFSALAIHPARGPPRGV